MNFENVFPQAAATGGGLDAFDDAVAAPEYSPLPPGTYTVRVKRGEVTMTKAGAESYSMTFEVIEGECTGRTVRRMWVFTPKAMEYAKRDLAPFGLTTKTKLLSPFPDAGREYHCRLTVALQAGDTGNQFNDVKRIDNLRVIESPAAMFMLPPVQGEGGPR